MLLSEAGKIAVTGVIHHDIDKIRISGGGVGKGENGGTKEDRSKMELHELGLMWEK